MRDRAGMYDEAIGSVESMTRSIKSISSNRSLKPKRSVFAWKYVLSEKKARFLEGFQQCFLNLGGFIFDHSLWFIIASFLVALVCSLSFFFIHFETRADLLYALPASRARSDLAKMTTLFGTPPRVNMVFVVSHNNDTILTPSVLRKVQYLDSFIKNDLRSSQVKVQRASEQTITFNYQDVCHRMDLPTVDFSSVSNDTDSLVLNGARASCYSMGPLDLYRSEKQFGKPLATRQWPYIPNVAENKIIKADLTLTDPSVTRLPSGTFRLTNATGFLFIYHTESGDPVKLARSLEWEGALISFINNHIKPHAAKGPAGDAMHDRLSEDKRFYDSTHWPNEWSNFNDTDWKDFQVFVNAQRSWRKIIQCASLLTSEDELGRATSLDARLMRDYCLAYLIIASYMIIVNHTNNLTRSKSICGFIGSLSALFGFCVGGGICYWLGLRHTPTMHASPFLVLAIGLDNTFVVLNFYTLAHSYVKSPRERCQMSLSDAGISITITTFTSIISFLVGAAGPYLAVRNFCYVTAMGLLGGYVMNIVFFFPFLCLESVAESNNEIFFFMPLIPKWVVAMIPSRMLPLEASMAAIKDIGTPPASKGPDSLPATTLSYNLHPAKRLDPFAASHPVAREQEFARLPAGASFGRKGSVTPPTSPTGHGAHFSTSYGHSGPSVQAARTVDEQSHQIWDNTDVSTDIFSSLRLQGNHTSPSNVDRNREIWSTQEYLRERLFPGKTIYELASIQWSFNKRNTQLQRELKQRHKKCDGMKMDSIADNLQNIPQMDFASIADPSEFSVLETPVDKIPSSVLPLVAQVVRLVRDCSDEPKGNVGKVSRGIFLNYLGPALIRPAVQVVIILLLIIYLGVSLFGAISYLSAGLDLENLTPPDSYLREAFLLSHDKFPLFPYETNVFFTAPRLTDDHEDIRGTRQILDSFVSDGYGTRRASDLKPLSLNDIAAHSGSGDGTSQKMDAFKNSLGEVPWWEPEAMRALIELDGTLRDMKTTQDVLNGMVLFYTEHAPAIFAEGTSTDERRRLFHTLLYKWLKSGVIGTHVRNQFRFENPSSDDPSRLPRLLGYRAMVFNYNFLNSFEQSQYMVEIRSKCDSLSIDWESVLIHPSEPPRMLEGKGRGFGISDPVFNLKKAPMPQYPTAGLDWARINSESPSWFSVKPFMETFLFFESDITILKATIINMSTAFVAIVLVSSLLMKGIGTAAIVTTMIIFVDIGVFGFMGIWNIHLNILSMILLVLSIGFSVDYTVHVVHTFTHCLGKTRADKAVETLILMCNPVTHGAISTLLGICPIGARDEFIMDTFFKMTVLVIVFGFLNGVIFLPIILSILGPVFPSTQVKSKALASHINEVVHPLIKSPIASL